MALVITDAPSEELLDVEVAKRHLRLFDNSLDDEVAQLIRASRDYCERWTSRTLRKSTTRTLTLDGWWSTEQKLPWPPLIAVTGIAYYDEDNASQTLSGANYVVELSTDGGGRIVWAADAELPSVYSRPDAITITFTAGYASADALPPVALQAMKTKITEMYGAGTENEVRAAMSATDRLLGLIDWTEYV